MSTCPDCGAPTRIRRQRCASCDAEQVAWLASCAPKTVQVSKHADGLLLTIPWRAVVPWWWHLFFACIAWFTLMSAGSSGSLIGFLFTVFWVGMLVNQDEILIRAHSVKFSRGPLPWLGFQGEVPRSQLSTLMVETRWVRTNRHGGLVPSYQLTSMGKVLMNGWGQPEVLEFVREAILQGTDAPAPSLRSGTLPQRPLPERTLQIANHDGGFRATVPLEPTALGRLKGVELGPSNLLEVGWVGLTAIPALLVAASLMPGATMLVLVLWVLPMVVATHVLSRWVETRPACIVDVDRGKVRVADQEGVVRSTLDLDRLRLDGRGQTLVLIAGEDREILRPAVPVDDLRARLTEAKQHHGSRADIPEALATMTTKT